MSLENLAERSAELFTRCFGRAPQWLAAQRAELALDVFDFWVGSVGIFLLATVQVILYGWALGIERGASEARQWQPRAN